jgi:hemerythrin-like metal-binding protein
MSGDIEWMPDMSVGISDLDDDHKILIRCLNEFILAADNDEGTMIIDPIFASLMEYCDYHFSREEGVMAACGYVNLEAHKKEHVVLTKRLIECRELLMLTNTKELSDEVREFLETWLRGHILKVDHAYGDTVAGREADYADQLAN